MRLRLGSAVAAVALLSACGGGGGGGNVISTPGPAPSPAPSPAPTPTPTPPPTPTPAPTSSFDTAEFKRSDGPGFHNAVPAWSVGATGAGVKIAVVDTGIDTDSPEFAGRIDPASSDVAGNGTVEAFDDHGTQVAMTAAAARNGTGIVGIAYNATILALRTDTPGTCKDQSSGDGTDGCTFSDTSIARAIDRAVANGATVINLSLGGDTPSSFLVSSVQKAVAAGAVIVVSAGNEGDGSDPDVDPNQPNPFATGVRNAGGANVIIVGSVNDQSQFSAFSNKAGAQAQYFLSALGERVCCVYKDGVLETTTDSTGTYVTVVSGTSFSAPQVAGAVALLKQAFPNLTGAQMVDLLLKRARDAGSTGTDALYGRGILDIGAAFAPSGVTVLAGSTALVRLDDDMAIGSSAMGDAFAGGSVATMVTDEYGRAYGYDLAQGLQRAAVAPRLLGAVDAGSHQVAGGSEAVSIAFTLADGSRGGVAPIASLRLTQDDARAARVLAGRVMLQLTPKSRVGFAFHERGDGLVAQLQGHSQAAFLIASDARGETGFAVTDANALAWRRQVGAWGITGSAATGNAQLGHLRLTGGVLDRRREELGLTNVSLGADRRFGAIESAIGLSLMNEDRTVLGGYFHDALGAGGANTVFLDANAGWAVSPHWRLGAAFRQGWTRADRVGIVGNGSNLASRAWSADVTKQGVFGASDSLGLRVSQPLRVESGGLSLELPVAYDYATLSPTYGTRRLSLAPSGREIDGELAWQGRLLGGSASASVYYRKDPGNVASLPSDAGVAIKWGRKF